MIREGTAIILLGIALSGLAAEPPAEPPTARPRIGLVLGGGGALGMAHVGVLEALEELRVPVDCIAGTSMGAIIGGFYAAGMSPAEIGELLIALDWWDLLNDKTSREYLGFRRKQDDARYLFDAELGFRPPWRVLVPPGLSAGQKLGILMRRETTAVASVRDFDSLNVPFRAVATDLISGETVILGSGNLPMALRASMAVPGIFTPVELDGRLLVDGGVVNNVPVDAAKAMNTDIIIAVDVGALKAEAIKKNLSNFATVLAQSFLLMQRPSIQSRIKEADVLIQPDLTAHSAADFHHAAQIIPPGADATRAHAEELSKWSVSEEEYAAYLRKQRRSRQPPQHVAAVRVDGNHRVDERAIRAVIVTRPEEELDFGTVERDVARIHGMGDFQTVVYEVRPSTGGCDVVYTVQEKPWGPGYLHFGLRLESNLDDESAWQFLLNYTLTRINRLGAELRMDADVGSDQRADIEFYQPLNPSAAFFVAPRVGSSSSVLPVFEDDRKIASYDVNLTDAELAAGMNIRDMGELRFGAVGGYGTAELNSGAEELPEFDGVIAGFTGRFTVDRLDHPFFARKGSYFQASAFLSRPAIGAEENYDKVSAEYRQCATVGSHTLQLSLLGASSLGSDIPVYDRFTLGGLDTLAGLSRDQLAGQYAGLIQVAYRYELARLPPALGRGIYAILRQDAGNAWDARGDISLSDLRYSTGLALAADTGIGPCGIGFAIADRENHQFFFSVGTLF
ncbi:MAG: NTE family protein RssA [Verrucomicrobia bacterium ADurb.Bin345]|nr:MAG: NTE family protein RssA [Verrucomicrobia bacterium ADurb.Bin345]